MDCGGETVSFPFSRGQAPLLIHAVAFPTSQFGKEGTLYDFRNIDVQELKQKCEELQHAQSGMKKKLNPKVMNMIDR